MKAEQLQNGCCPVCNTPIAPAPRPEAPDWPLKLFCETHIDTTLADANVNDPCPLCAAEKRNEAHTLPPQVDAETLIGEISDAINDVINPDAWNRVRAIIHKRLAAPKDGRQEPGAAK